MNRARFERLNILGFHVELREQSTSRLNSVARTFYLEFIAAIPNGNAETQLELTDVSVYGAAKRGKSTWVAWFKIELFSSLINYLVFAQLFFWHMDTKWMR